ncbi:MAG TPA: hypothetical protein VFI15_05245 [Candidatus Limnocylindrales bacterium]|nr:hypothetical protein [Candidatus Limnocylindrales bacterium]
MAHRIQMKLGVVPDAERAADSPDTALHVAPRVGAQTRTKGHLYLLVTSRTGGAKAREATRLVADAIRTEYYYDESAGIRVCLVKAIQAANKRLTHARERSALGTGPGPIGVALAVVRDTELYVCTVGPAEAYLNRGARLSTLPDPHRDRGLPSADIEPDVWRGEIDVGDQLLLVSPAVVVALGSDAIKDALVTLHPQSAVETLAARFRESGGNGSDGALVIEASEIAVARAGVVPVPVRPAEPLAGSPDRSPIPLADSVASGLAAAQTRARTARGAVGGVLYRLLSRGLDALPARGAPNRRVTPLSARREMQRRAAMALLSLVVVVGGLGIAVFVLGGNKPQGPAIQTLDAAAGAIDKAREDLNRVIGPGIDLVANDPNKAEQLLTEAYQKLDAARQAGVPASTVDPIRKQVVAALDRLYGMVDVASTSIFKFPAEPAVDLRAIVKGPDGMPFVLDAATKSVYRIDLAGHKASVIFREGNKAAGATESAPKLIGVGGRDLLMVDAKNVVWRWRPANLTGKGSISRVRVTGSAEWGNDILAIGTFLRDPEANLYNLYVVDPSAQQIKRYSPAADGSGFPAQPNLWLSSVRDLTKVTGMYIDGDVWIADGGILYRYSGGASVGWSAAELDDGILRPAPAYRWIGSGSEKRTGTIYGFDPGSDRLVGISKVNGSFVVQYRLAGGNTGWADFRGFYVEPGLDQEPDAIVWISKNGIGRALLQPVGPLGSPAPDGSPAATSSAPTATPRS